MQLKMKNLYLPVRSSTICFLQVISIATIVPISVLCNNIANAQSCVESLNIKHSTLLDVRVLRFWEEEKHLYSTMCICL